MGEGKCTFAPRTSIDPQMLMEIIYREVKHHRNYKEYRPNFGSKPVTGKFYAAHDTKESLDEEEVRKIGWYHENVSHTRARGPKSKYPAPATENQCYGWFLDPLIEVDRNDRRFYAPKRENEQTKIELIIRKCLVKRE